MTTFGIMILFALASPVGAMNGSLPLDLFDSATSIQTGYAVVTAPSGRSGDLEVIQTTRFKDGMVSLQSEAVPGVLTAGSTFFVNISDRLGRDLGLALTNLSDNAARVTLTMRREDGATVGSHTFYVQPHRQLSRFVTEFLSTLAGLPTELAGTLVVSSSIPVSMTAVRFEGGAFSFEAPVQSSGGTSVPEVLPGVGGDGAILLPYFIQGGGWSTEIVLMNRGSEDMTVRLDLFNPRGDPMMATLNNASRSTFTGLFIRAGGVLVISPPDDPSGN